MFWLIDFIYGGCDNLVGVSVYISLINFGHKIYLMMTKLWYNIRMTIIDGFSCFAVYVLGNNTRVEPYFESCKETIKIWFNPSIIRQYIHSKTAENHLLFSNYTLGYYCIPQIRKKYI